MISARLITVIVGALLICVSSARADDNHYQNYIVGERATGFGGAFTAISDDSSGAYYNPSGLAESPHSSFSLSASVYGFSSQSFAIGAVDFESDNRSFVSYPTTAAWIQRVRKGNEDGSGRIQLALSIISPQSNIKRQRFAFRNAPQDAGEPGQVVIMDQLHVQISEDDSLWLGLSAAWKIWRWLSVGATVYGTMRTGVYQLHEQFIGTQVDTASQTEVLRFGLAQRADATFTQYGLVGVGGIMVSMTEHLRMGAAFRSPSLRIRGKADFDGLATPIDEQSGNVRLESQVIKGATFRDQQPFKATLGAAYLVPRRFGASVDFSIFGPVGEYAIFETDADPSLERGVRMKKRLVWQLNAGGEYYLAGFFPLRLGFFTNLSSLADFETCDDSGQCIQHENMFTDGVDLYGLSGSVGYEIERATLTMGASYAFGSRTRNINQMDLEEWRSFLFIAMGGSFRF